MRKISQKRARAAIARVKELEEQRREERRAWSRTYPGGSHIATFTLGDDRVSGVLDGAHRLKHPLVAVVDGDKLMIYALPA